MTSPQQAKTPQELKQTVGKDRKPFQEESVSDEPSQRPVPFLAWPLLALAICLVSSSAATFETMPDVPPSALAAWRAQATSILLVPFAAWQLFCMKAEERLKLLQQLPLIITAGLSLGTHFGCWVWGLQHTSLSHALFIMSSTPVVIAAGSLLLGQVLSRGELVGTALGTAGAFVLAFAGQSDRGAGLIGDGMCAVAVLGFVAYFSIGKRLSTWVPLFAYMFLITSVAAAALSTAAVGAGEVGFSHMGRQGLFGWVDPQYLVGVGWLAAGPGFVGHTSFNALLKWMHPLTIALASTICPILGSFIGWGIGVSAFPHGAPTYIGAVMIIIACILDEAIQKQDAAQN
ncbi:hypothetical protein WJX73_009946 [Symbiochloris irregularis]|uniref:EamA domain-containing protein n=1 Tax=Symbiochloris irregularis TaxID=706552 RepID=A0AAW1NMK2_9CHLO